MTDPHHHTIIRQAIEATYSQRNRLLTLQTPLGQDAFVVAQVQGREAVNECFEFNVECLAADSHYELNALLGARATLGLLLAAGNRRCWHGYVLCASNLGTDGGLSRYRLRLRPWLAFLAHRRNTQIFQDVSALQVVERVLADYPEADYDLQVSRPLVRRPICTQYRETDLAFVERLLFEEGLSYRFSQAPRLADAGEAGRCTLQVFDRTPAAPNLSPAHIRFHRQSAAENADGITRFRRADAITPNRVAVSAWDAGQLQIHAGEAGQGAEEPGAFGQASMLSIFDGSLASPRHRSRAVLQQDAENRMAALRLPGRMITGEGGARVIQAGLAFSLVDHPSDDGRYIALSVEHRAMNNLGAHLARTLSSPLLENGNYRNTFRAVPDGTALVSQAHPKPRAGGPETAFVVGVAQQALTSNRDHCVKIQFPWQRGAQPLTGGLVEPGSGANSQGNAPGDERSGTWVRLGEMSAGPNWGSVFVPRLGSEVLVDYLDGDIDSPHIIGRLYNGVDDLPFAAGTDSAANHPGTLSGIQTRPADSEKPATANYHSGGHKPVNQWVMDDSPLQLRQSLATSQADSHLGLGYLINQHGACRGAYRGEGFELSTQAWLTARAAAGMLISTQRQAHNAGAAMAPQAAVGRLLAAKARAEALSAVAQAQGATALNANSAQQAFLANVDPRQAGHFDGSVGGQPSATHQPGSRKPGAPAESFAQPAILLESAASLSATTPASSVFHAGQSTHITTQGEMQQSAGTGYSSGSGQTTSLFTHDGGIQASAARGPVSIQAHDDSLEILADDSVSVTSSRDRIDILAQDKIVLTSGQSSVTLEGGNITFACPGTFTVKGGTHTFTGPASTPACTQALPTGKIRLPEFRQVSLTPSALRWDENIKPPRSDFFSPSQAAGEDQANTREPVVDRPEEQIITLRIGLFFDGTGNNRENAIAAACGPQTPSFPATEIPHIDQLCRDQNPSVPLAEGSYANARSNVARLFDLYVDGSTKTLKSAATSASLRVYIQGIGTSVGDEDAFWGQAAGIGATGVVARVNSSSEEILRQIRAFRGRNPTTRIQRLEFDVFGFSRGAAAARHFTNDMFKGPGSAMNQLWRNNPDVFVDGFSGSYGGELQVRFVGLFDSVAAIMDPLRGDFSPSDARNANVKLYLPLAKVEKVLHLRAADEYREAFALNQVVPGHEEIILPGAHSDLGGGYLREGTEKLLVTKSRYSYEGNPKRVHESAAYRKAKQDLEAWKRQHPRLAQHPGLRLHVQATAVPRHEKPSPAPRYRVMAVGILERTVRGELSLVYAHIMRELSENAGVPFRSIDVSMLELQLPSDLKAIYPKLLAQAKGSPTTLTAAERELLHKKYIHISSHWETRLGIAAMKPADNYQRIVHAHAPDAN